MEKKAEPETAVRKIVKEDFPVQGLDCADCAQLLEKAVCKLKGVASATSKSRSLTSITRQEL